MRYFTARRWLAGIVTAIIAVVLALLLLGYSLALHHAAYLSGWMLLAVVLFLASYNVRKKLTYPPLLKSAVWLQLHVYGGLLLIVLFFLHTGFRLPSGGFESLLALLVMSVVVSGVIGLVLSRVVPPRLAVRGEEIIFERIAMFRRQLRGQAEQLVVDSVEQSNMSTLADFYDRRLADYFRGPRNAWRHLGQSTRPLNQLINELRALERYLSTQERQTAAELAELIETKDNLDYCYAMQGALKCWLFVHIPLTYVLLPFVVVHVVLVRAFSGSWS